MYIGAFLLVWLPYIIIMFLYKYQPIHARFVVSIFLPLQGVLNVFIYANLFETVKKCVLSIMESIGERIKRINIEGSQ